MWSEEGRSLKFESSPIFPYSLVFFLRKAPPPFSCLQGGEQQQLFPIYFSFFPDRSSGRKLPRIFPSLSGGKSLALLGQTFFLPPPIVRGRRETWKFERAFRHRRRYSECIFCILYSLRLRNIIRSISFAKKYVKCWSDMWKVGPRFLDLLLLIFWRIEGELENTLLTQYPTSPWAKPPPRKKRKA